MLINMKKFKKWHDRVPVRLILAGQSQFAVVKTSLLIMEMRTQLQLN